MRVTHVITRLIVGGAQENTVASVLGLQKYEGWHISLISGSETGAEGSLASAFQSKPGTLTFVPHLVRPVHPWKDWRALRQLTDIFRTTSPQIVHTHSGKAGVLGRLAAAKAGVPIIIHTIHGPSFGAFQSRSANALFRFAERYAGKRTTHFVSVAAAMTDQYLAAGIGRREQYTEIRSGFDLEPFLAATNDPLVRARWGIEPADIVVGKIARLTALKGHEELLAAAPSLLRQCPRIRFLLAGDGERRGQLENQAQTLGIAGRVTFTGLVAPAEIALLIGIMDVVVHLSRREGLPRALSQALAASRPVVAYDCDGAKEVCIDNETGFLLAPGDVSGLSDRLLRLARDPALRAQLGKRGQDLVRNQFGLDRMVEGLRRLYLELARARRIEPT